MVSWQRFCVVESSANIQQLVKFKDEFCLFEPRKFKWMQIINALDTSWKKSIKEEHAFITRTFILTTIYYH